MANQAVWFRNDLRITDHEPLTAACARATQTGGQVFAIYIIDPRFFAQTRFGFERTGAFRRQFLRESLEDLSCRLKDLGGCLRIAAGHPEDVLPPMAAAESVECFHFQRAIAVEERAIENRVTEALHDVGVQQNGCEPGTLHDACDLPFEIAELPEIFTQFRKRVEKCSSVRPPLHAPVRIPSRDSVGSISDQIAETFAAPLLTGRRQAKPTPVDVFQFVGGETAARLRMQQWIWDRDRLKTYKETRNGMLSADDASRLSPWLALGCVSPRSIFAEVERYEAERISNESTYWLVFELLWRDYFAFIVQKHGAAVFQQSGLRRVRLPWSSDEQIFAAWRDGQTGYPLIDACMRELAATGFMSNRGRQNVASFLTRNLGVDWRMGAEWFESLLVDFDPCSNYGNWNYSAGVGNDARGFRWFNTTKQAREYDPRGEFVRHWLPELVNVPNSFVHEPWNMSVTEQERTGCRVGHTYPSPVVDLFGSAHANEELYQNATNAPRKRRSRRRR